MEIKENDKEVLIVGNDDDNRYVAFEENNREKLNVGDGDDNREC